MKPLINNIQNSSTLYHLQASFVSLSRVITATTLQPDLPNRSCCVLNKDRERFWTTLIGGKKKPENVNRQQI